MMKKAIRQTLCAMLSAAMLLGVCACGTGGTTGLSAGTVDLMANVKPSQKALSFQKDSGLERTFELEYREFAFGLFSRCARKDDSKKNMLVSPLSVMTALAMTANGAKANTLDEMMKALGGGTALPESLRPLEPAEFNQYLGAYLKNLPSDRKAMFRSANSIWVREGSMDVRKEFLQANADYFGADVFSAKFDGSTLNDVNRWVSDNTGGMIPSILDEIPSAAVLYLINALSFDAEWKEIYREDQVSEGVFTDIDGGTEPVSMMYSHESGYLDDGKATGFIKPYSSGYSFVAMLPNEGVTLDEYIGMMPHLGVFEQIRKGSREPVLVSIPKFSAEYSAELSGLLREMGMNEAFDPDNADFSGMADVGKGELYISRVIHKTAVRVDEKGTKAGAATAVEMKTNGALMAKSVYLDRPFVYMIVDDQNGLPIFIGQVTGVKAE